MGTIISKAAGWMLKNPAVVLLLIFAAMFAMVVVAKNAELAEVRRSSATKDETIKSTRDALSQARSNVATLNGTLTQQNAAIMALKDQGAQQGVKFDILIKDMEAANISTAKRIAIIDAARPGPDKCQSAMDLLKGAAQ